jgi:hypothetical protein
VCQLAAVQKVYRLVWLKKVQFWRLVLCHLAGGLKRFHLTFCSFDRRLKKTENHFIVHKAISICTQCSKSQCLINWGESLSNAGLRPFLKLPAGHSVLKACNISARHGCLVRLPGQVAGQGFWARLHSIVQYAECMVKLENNAIF